MSQNHKRESILIVTELYPNSNNSFLGTFVVSQIEALRQYYHVVVIVPYSLGIRDHLQSERQKTIHLHNLDVYYIPQHSLVILLLHIFKILKWPSVSYWNKKFLPRRIINLAKKLHKKINFSLVHGHESYIGDEAGMIGKRLGIPSVVTIHGLYDYHKLGFGEKVMNQVIKNLNIANRLFAVSKIAAVSYQKNGVNREIDIIPNGLDESAVKRANPLPEKWQKIIQGKTVILTVGFF